jgi:hypothetical protein
VRRRGNLRLAWCHSVATRGIAEREERVGAATKRPQAWGPRKRPAEKQLAYRRGEKVGYSPRPLFLSYHLFSNMRDNRMNTGYFNDPAFFNYLSYFSCLRLISGQNRHQRHQTEH